MNPVMTNHSVERDPLENDTATAATPASRLSKWLDERLNLTELLYPLKKKAVPMHRLSHWYFLGGITLFLFMIQVTTGILLLLYYRPGAAEAFESVQYITTQVPMGWLIRGLHHWGASAMIVLVGLHMLRVILFGAYKYPREVTWFTGVILLLVVIGFGFTGYLLPWDQKAYWATTVGTRIAGAPPLIGDYPLHIIRGGPEISAVTLVRFCRRGRVVRFGRRGRLVRLGRRCHDHARAVAIRVVSIALVLCARDGRRAVVARVVDLERRHRIDRLCDRVIVLDAGSTIAMGTPAEVLADPKVRLAYLGEASLPEMAPPKTRPVSNSNPLPVGSGLISMWTSAN